MYTTSPNNMLYEKEDPNYEKVTQKIPMHAALCEYAGSPDSLRRKGRHSTVNEHGHDSGDNKHGHESR